jgi:hypothetical protein
LVERLTERYITSADNRTGVEDLKDGLFKQVQNKHWNKAVKGMRTVKYGLRDLINF